MTQMEEKVLVLCAHPDGQIIGPGATIAKYAEEGKKVYAFIFSYGEMNPFWLKARITKQIRKNESDEAGKIIGITKTIYLGLKEGMFEKEIKEKKIKNKVKDFIRRHNIKKIFTHSLDDPHPDHKVIANFALEVASKGINVYTFKVWNPFSLKHSSEPKIYVDVSKTFKKKMMALKKFKSQSLVIWMFIPFLYFGASYNGLKNGKRFCESFIKVK